MRVQNLATFSQEAKISAHHGSKKKIEKKIIQLKKKKCCEKKKLYNLRQKWCENLITEVKSMSNMSDVF